ncbi:PGDYG domain-containing protein [Brevundimonas vesicularis]|uniref:PGDYG domain-containing protein n=1 Tax=Brevundimonas vesicularis TaxID=41276 RepID=UPI0022AC8CBB|nr:PGDYG domain-containing protein [Brevundimonas vesicularis]
MKYRKTALVEAEQFLPAEDKIPPGVFSDGLSDPRKSTSQWVLETLEGRHTLRPGDYICTGPAGERWNVERSIFEATYELVTTQPDTGKVEAGGVEREAFDAVSTLAEAMTMFADHGGTLIADAGSSFHEPS